MTLRERFAAVWAWLQETCLKECPPAWEHDWEHDPGVIVDSKGTYRTDAGIPLWDICHREVYSRFCQRCGATEQYMQSGADPGDGHPIVGWSRVPSRVVT